MQKNLTSDDIAGDPTNLPLRAHEIIEDAIRDHLSGIDDEGAGAAYAMTYADTQVDKIVLAELASLIDARSPGLVARLRRPARRARQALMATPRSTAGGCRLARRPARRPAAGRRRDRRAARDPRLGPGPARSPAVSLTDTQLKNSDRHDRATNR